MLHFKKVMCVDLLLCVVRREREARGREARRGSREIKGMRDSREGKEGGGVFER